MSTLYLLALAGVCLAIFAMLWEALIAVIRPADWERQRFVLETLPPEEAPRADQYAGAMAWLPAHAVAPQSAPKLQALGRFDDVEEALSAAC